MKQRIEEPLLHLIQHIFLRKHLLYALLDLKSYFPLLFLLQ